ncbi:MAG TPA: hypothetical protein VLB10_00080 [Gammaproteobacteria bacterium]|jgi:hypothetical protein|nr:hypothetical protein [Gammaproteobacteria bacterium]
MTGLLRKTLVTGLILVVSTGAALAEVIKPFVLAGTSGGDVASVSAEVKSKLTAGGFEVVGEYSPYADTNIIIVTNDAQKGHAAKSEFGGYGAISRVSVTKNGDNTEVVYTNPVYMAAAYRMAVDMADIRASLESALGAQQDFGTGDKQLTADDMRKYHYTVMMEYFDDPSDLAEYDSQAEAVKAVEDSLAAGAGGGSKVYRVDIPGKDETVFGVALAGADADDCSGDEFIMSRIDKDTPRSSAHLPYEIVVTDGVARALYARFRIAINWPHLPMVASETGGTFMSIMCSPGAIEEALIQAAGETP